MKKKIKDWAVFSFVMVCIAFVCSVVELGIMAVPELLIGGFFCFVALLISGLMAEVVDNVIERNKLQKVCGWSIGTAVAIAFFWFVWGISSGKIPTVSTPDFGGLIPTFKISRLWDILIGPVWSILLVYLFSKANNERGDLDEVAFWGHGGGVAVSLIFAVDLGVTAGLAALSLYCGAVCAAFTVIKISVALTKRRTLVF